MTTMHDPGLHDPFPDQLNAARFRAERDAARQELARLRDEMEDMRPRLMPEGMELEGNVLRIRTAENVDYDGETLFVLIGGGDE